MSVVVTRISISFENVHLTDPDMMDAAEGMDDPSLLLVTDGEIGAIVGD